MLPRLRHAWRRSASTATAIALVAAGVVAGTVAAVPAHAAPAATAVDLAYVVDHEDGFHPGQVHVIDVATNTVVGSIPMPTSPVAVVASPDKRTAYVVTNGEFREDGQVAVIDAATNTVTHTIGVCGTDPTEAAISPDGSRLWASCDNGDISVIDTATDQEIKTFNVGEKYLSGLTFSPDGSTVYATFFLSPPPNYAGVLAIDTATETVTATIADNYVSDGLILGPDGSTAFVPQEIFDPSTRTTTPSLAAIDTVSRTIASIPTGERLGSGVVDPAGTDAYYCGDGGLTEVDLAARTIARTVPSPCGGPETGSPDVMSFGPDPDTLYYVTYTGIQVIDVRTGNVTATITDPADFTELQGAVAFVRAPVIPTIASISPAKGAEAGGGKVVITGGPFLGRAGATGVSFGGVPATSYTIDSDSQITAVVPPQTARTVDVTVTNANGTSAAGQADHYTYLAIPTFTSMTPTSGVSSGGTSVVITGTHMSTTTGVYFGGTAASSFTIDSDTQVTAVTRAQTNGTVDVTVTNTAGTSATVPADQFTFFSPVPIATSVSPPSGPTAGGTTVTITGERFTGTFRVDVGGVAVPYTLDSDSQITAVTPPGPAGTVDVTVTTDVGTSATGTADQFTYTPSA